jgi:hypothetical protein
MTSIEKANLFNLKKAERQRRDEILFLKYANESVARSKRLLKKGFITIKEFSEKTSNSFLREIYKNLTCFIS